MRATTTLRPGPYVAALRARFLLTLQYRAAALAGFATQCWWGGMKVMILAAFYARSGHQPLSLPQACAYVWLGQAFLVFLPWNPDPDIADMVRTGGVAYERLRPVDAYGWWYARTLAWSLARVAPRAAPMLMVAALILPLCGLGAWGLKPPPSLAAGIGFLVSIGLTALLSAAMLQGLHVMVVAAGSPRGINLMAPALVNLLSGGIAPLPLFPAWSQGLLFIQPFAGLVDIPFRIYLGTLSGGMALAGLALQLAWTLVLAVGGRMALERVFARMEIQGG